MFLIRILNVESESFLSMFEVFDGPWLSVGGVQ